MNQYQKERFEDIKKAFYQSDFGKYLYKDKIEVVPKFIEDFEFLINLVDQIDFGNHIPHID